MSSLWKILALTSAFFMLSGVLAGQEKPKERIAVAGAGAVRPILDAAAREFERTHPDLAIEVRADDSADGLREVAEGRAQIGMIAREMQELERMRWGDLELTVFAIEGIAIAVHPSNPVRRIRMQQVARVYGGRIGNWSELGGRDALIARISRPQDHPTCRWFLDCCGLERDEKALPQENVLALRKGAVPVVTRASNAEILAALEKDPNAIACVSLNGAQETAAVQGRIRLLELDDVLATVENVAEAGYPFQRPLCVATRGRPEGATREFVDFLMSEQGQRLVEKLEYVPVRPPTPE